MRTRNGHFIGSIWRRKNEDFGRINYGIAVSLLCYKLFSNKTNPNELKFLGTDEDRQVGSI